MKSLPLTALVAALALAACNQTAETSDNALVNAENATDLGDAALAEDDAPVIEDAAGPSAVAVAVPALPKPAAGTPKTEAAPLNDAAEIEEEIRAGTGIQRIRHGQGWAWTRGGRILRTADRDGGNVAYFRGGADRPFLVQRGERAYAYDGDRPAREFDRDGRGRAPDADRAREATEAAREAREQRQRAERARENARPAAGRDGDRNRDRDDDRRPRATPTPTPSPTTRTPGGRDPNDRPGWTRPTPTPSPATTDRPRRDRDRDRGER